MTKEVPRTSVLRDAELIARLRGWARDIQEGSKAIWAMDQDLKEAADRIEQLVATNEALIAERDKQAGYKGDAMAAYCEACLQLREAETKLTKAVWRLEQMRDDVTGYRHVSHFRRGATVTLAEIKGESHE